MQLHGLSPTCCLLPTAHCAPSPLVNLQARIEQAEAGGCPEGMVSDAKRQLHRLLLAEVRGRGRRPWDLPAKV